MEGADEIRARAPWVEGMDPFRPLYDEHFAFVTAIVRRMGVRDADVPDVVQEIFATLARQVERGMDTSAHVRGYLAKIALSRVVDSKRLAYNREQPHADEGAVDALVDARS